MRFFYNIRDMLGSLLIAAALGGSPLPATGNELPSHDVRRWGAVCDGSADDTAALIRAGRSSLEILIPEPLRCRVTGPLAAGIRSGQRWHGGGEIQTDDGFNFTVFSVRGKQNVVFEDLSGLSGTLAVPAPRADARFVEFISGSHGGQVRDCRIEGFQQAVRVHASSGIRITGNAIIASLGWGISIQSNSHQTLIDGNLVSGTRFEHGIYVAGSPDAPARATTITANQVLASGRDGIKLSFVDGATITGNIVTGSGGQGIYLTDASRAVQMRRNLAQANAGHGILIFDRSAAMAGIDIQFNLVYANSSGGIALRGGPATVANNEADGP
jgi:parallel beta-helix repeat protein